MNNSQINSQEKSIFKYNTNINFYVNSQLNPNTQTQRLSSQFSTFVPRTTNIGNINIENELRGITRNSSKCQCHKMPMSQMPMSQISWK